MKAPKIAIGVRYGERRVLGGAAPDRTGRPRYLAECSCGRQSVVYAFQLVGNSAATSCSLCAAGRRAGTVYRCGACGGAGHSRRSCRQRRSA